MRILLPGRYFVKDNPYQHKSFFQDGKAATAGGG
jgi:hypothetical protein